MGLDPEKIRGADKELWRFILSLALAFNDLKNFHYVLFQILKVDGHAVRAKEPGHFGQLSGMGIQLSRLVASVVHELLELIRNHKKLIATPPFQRLLAKLPAKPRRRWQAVVDVAFHDATHNSTASHHLMRLRNSVGFHYAPKVIAKGYESFLANPRAVNDRAVSSVGTTLQASRFYFADAAAEGAFEAALGVPRIQFEKDLNPLLWDINEGLHAVVTTYLTNIGDARPYTMKKRVGS